MRDKDKTKEQLINELAELRLRARELETSAAECKQAEEMLRNSDKRVHSMVEDMPALICRFARWNADICKQQLLQLL